MIRRAAIPYLAAISSASVDSPFPGRNSAVPDC